MAFLMDNGTSFLMRAAKNYSRIVMEATKEDQIIEFKYDKKTYKIRVVRLILESGEEEILITDLLDLMYTVKVLKELYFMRWGIESKYNELKNRLEIENFSGTTKIAIEQDFYAAITVSNLVELARNQCDEELDNERTDTSNKYKYKLNLNILIGELKDNLILILLEPSPIKRTKMFKKMMTKIKRSVVPIRPERHNPRVKKRTRNKYKINQKRCL
jgi:hypothetical protein